ncbi:subtilisin-like protease [Henckelia pumila]|uniref:subtilisin-like protease n=1 Tax=Henckelia pumila TaxID=405737 RepID=UPI003C6E20A6
MTYPHLCGIASLLRNVHPEWFPASIKFAIMTSTDQVNLARTHIEDQTLRPASVFATSSVHVNILKVIDPGLVYDLSPQDYLSDLCGLGYIDQEIDYIVNRDVTCSQISSIPEAQLNYPSFSVVVETISQACSRTVTNLRE